MDVMRRNKILAAVIVLAALLLCALFLLYRSGVSLFSDENYIRHDLRFEIRAGESVLFSSDRMFPFLGADEIELENDENTSVECTLLFNGRIVTETVLARSRKTLSIKESGAFSVLLKTGKNTLFYPASAGDFTTTIPALPGADVVFLNPVDLRSFSLSVPARMFGDFTFTDLTLETSASGRIVLSPNSAFEAQILLYAPGCDFAFRNISLITQARLEEYYLTAATVNGENRETGRFPVKDFDMLSRLFDPNALPRLISGDTVEIVESFALGEDLFFEGFLSFTLNEKLIPAGHSIYLSSSKEGLYTVKTAAGAYSDYTILTVTAPRAALVWEGEGTIPLFRCMEQHNNLFSYNDRETLLGGAGIAEPILSLPALENDFLQEDLVFTVYGNVLEGVLPYDFDASSLQTPHFTLSASGGFARLDGDYLTASSTVITTDESGTEHRYGVSILREKKNLPVLYLETENAEEIASKTQYVRGSLALDAENTGFESVATTSVRLRGRGNSTWKWEKKPYKIHFDEPTSILGLPAAEEWALFANYADKSLMRNQIGLSMARNLSFDYVPTLTPVDVFLNGEYIGVYSLGEHLEEGEGRITVRHEPGQSDCGFFLEAGGVVSGVDVNGMNYFHAGLVKFVLIKSPDYKTLTTSQFRFIKKYMQKANAAVVSGQGYEEYLDMESLVDWMILTELSFNTDSSWRRSTYFIKNPGEKLKMALVWDFDLAFGNFSKDVGTYDVWVSYNKDDDYVGETWSQYLLEDPAFQREFRARWNEVKDRLVESALEEIDNTFQTVSDSAEENFRRWDILGKKVAFERKDNSQYKTYASQIRYLKDFIRDRAAWIDENTADW